MHDLIEEMGLNIVRRGSKHPRNRSRLSYIKEVSDVLANKKVTKNKLTFFSPNQTIHAF